jgi:Exostosin family
MQHAAGAHDAQWPDQSTTQLAAGVFDPHSLKLHAPQGTLTVYVYQPSDSPELADLLECTREPWSDGERLEDAVIESFSQIGVVTADPDLASFFLVPAKPACLIQGLTEAVVSELYRRALESLAHFQKSGGRNHLFVFSTPEGPGIFKDWCA